MELYLSASNLANTAFVTPGGVGKYVVTTPKDPGASPRISTIQWAALNAQDSLVAEIEWKTRGSHSLIRGPLFSANAERRNIVGLGTSASDFLYKKKLFGSLSRYFIGNDKQEYRWKPDIHNKGLILTNNTTGEPTAQFFFKMIPEEGIYAGQPRSLLCIQPSPTLDMDLVVLSFLIMETKRRERLGDMIHDDDAGINEGGGDC